MKIESVSWRTILHYCAWLFILSWGLQTMAILTTEGLDDPAMKWWLAATMFTPAIVTFFYLYFNPTLKHKLLWRPNLRLIGTTFLAVFIPILFAFTAVIIFESFYWGKSQWFTFSVNDVVISGGPFLLGLGSQSWLLFSLNIFTTGFVFAVMNSFFAAGEEIAWRGLFQGLLIERLGVSKGILLLGFIWSMWHLPIQLFGYNYPENPVLGSLIISPIIMIGYSFFMGWLTLHARSFIPAAIAHGAGNGIQEGIISQIHLSTPELYLYLIRLLISATIGFVFMYFLIRNNSKSRFQNDH